MLLACSAAQELATVALAPTALFLSWILPLPMSTHDDLGRQDRVEGLLVGDWKGVVMLAVEQTYGFAKKRDADGRTRWAAFGETIQPRT